MENQVPKIIAHRGFSKVFPENTRLAFDNAVDATVDGIEFDVQLTKDNRLAIYHDRTLFRLAGIKKRVIDFDFDEIQELELKKKKTRELLELNDFFASYSGKVEFFLELKSREYDRKKGSRASVVKLLSEIRKRYPDTVLNVLSFDRVLLESFLEEGRSWKLIWNLSEENIQKKNYQHIPGLLGVCTSWHLLGEWTESISSQEKKLFCYSCNSRRSLNHSLKFHPDGIMTDNPQFLIRELK